MGNDELKNIGEVSLAEHFLDLSVCSPESQEDDFLGDILEVFFFS